MVLCANCLPICLLFFLGFFAFRFLFFFVGRVWVCVCLDYSRTNEQIFIKKFVGRT